MYMRGVEGENHEYATRFSRPLFPASSLCFRSRFLPLRPPPPLVLILPLLLLPPTVGILQGETAKKNRRKERRRGNAMYMYKEKTRGIVRSKGKQITIP